MTMTQPTKKRTSTIKGQTILAMCRAHFPEMTDEQHDGVALVVYQFSMGFLPGTAFSSKLRPYNRMLNGQAPEITQRIRDFRTAVQHSYYVSAAFWRAMILYAGGVPYSAIRKGYPVFLGDLKLCSELLSDEQYVEVVEMHGTRSIHQISREDYEWLVGKAHTIATGVYRRKLRYLGKYDQSLDLAADLLVAGIRVIHRYSHYPSRERILGSVAMSINNEAERLREHHQAEKRAALKKLPAFRCGECNTTWEHRKNKGLVPFAVALKQAWLFKPDQMDVDHMYCEKCSTRTAPVQVDAINGEREYQSTLVSISPIPTAEGGSISIEKADENALLGDQAAMETEFVTQLHERLPPEQQDFLRVFLGSDDAFDAWLDQRKASRVNRCETLAALVCEYLHIDWKSIKADLGAMLGMPRAYLVESDGDSDVVFAADPSHAVHYVARHYRYKNGKAMEADTGKVRVREYVELSPGLQHVEVTEGRVYAIEDLPAL